LITTVKSTRPLTVDAGATHSRLEALNTVALLLLSPNMQVADTEAPSSSPFKKSLPPTVTVSPPSIEPMVGLTLLNEGAATNSKDTVSEELTELAFTDIETSPVTCAGVRQVNSESLTYTAGTASEPNTHSSSLLNEKPEPLTTTDVLPRVDPNAGLTEVTSGGTMYVYTNGVLTVMPSNDRPMDTSPAVVVTGDTHSSAVLFRTRASDIPDPKLHFTFSVPANDKPLTSTTSPPERLPYFGEHEVATTVSM
jgi:hypothetical protein